MESNSIERRKAKRELKRVVTKFVSLVDMGANETEFALYKRKEGTAGDTAGDQPPPSGAAVTGQTRKEADMAGKKKKTDKTTKSLPDGTWGAQNAIKSAMSWLAPIAGIGGDPWDSTALAEGTVKQVQDIVKTLGSIIGFPQAVEAVSKKAEMSEEDVAEMITKFREELEEAGIATIDTAAPVEKKGAKISKERLKKIQAAVDALKSVLKDAGIEVEASDAKKYMADTHHVELEVDETAKDDDPPADPAEPPAEPAAEPTATDDPPAEAGTDDDPAADPAEGNDPAEPAGDDSAATGVEKSLQGITDILKQVQATQKEQGDRLSAIEGTPGMSQADAGDDTGGGAPSAEDINKQHGLSSFGEALGLRK